jgi:hypothetical protein
VQSRGPGRCLVACDMRAWRHAGYSCTVSTTYLRLNCVWICYRTEGSAAQFGFRVLAPTRGTRTRDTDV